MSLSMRQRGITPENMDRYVVVWREGSDLRTLTYRPEGYVRTYPKEQIDPRARVDLVTQDFDEMVEALKQDKHVAVTVRIAQWFGNDWVFAPPGYGF